MTPLIIGFTPPGHCELCGKFDELRPYGANGERICYECGMKNPEETERQLEKLLFGGPVQ